MGPQGLSTQVAVLGCCTKGKLGRVPLPTAFSNAARTLQRTWSDPPDTRQVGEDVLLMREVHLGLRKGRLKYEDITQDLPSERMFLARTERNTPLHEPE